MNKKTYSIPYVYTKPINLTSEVEKMLVIQELISLVYQLIYQVHNDLKNHKFSPISDFLLEQVQIGSTNKSGFYLLINSSNAKVYFGETCNFSTRKADYSYSLRQAKTGKKKKKISANIIQEIVDNKAQVSDFLWIPLLMIEKKQYILKNQSTKSSENVQTVQNAQKSSFLREIETQVLTQLLEENQISLYNKQIGSVFTKGNKFGGSNTSGKPSIPVKINDFAFESILCAANALQVDRKTIRNKKNKFCFELTKEEWLNWNPSKKITHEIVDDFKTNYPNFYQQLKISNP
jgi:hypothetical protein